MEENGNDSTPIAKSRSNCSLRSRSFSTPLSTFNRLSSNYGSFGADDLSEDESMSIEIILQDETSQDSGVFSPKKTDSPNSSPSNLLSNLNINKNNTPSPQVGKVGVGARASGITRGRHIINKSITDLLYRPIKNAATTTDGQTFEGKENSCKRKSDDKLDGDESFKRPCPPSEFVPSKRAKCLTLDSAPLQDLFNKSPLHKAFGKSSESNFEPSSVPSTSPFQRSHSESSLSIKKALERIDSDPLLIGDGSRRHVLPLVGGKNTDLKEISCDTLVDLVTGLRKVDGRFKVIDCRYPYEFEGGHIKEAVNLFTQKQSFEAFFDEPKVRMSDDNEFRATDSSQRLVLIFHCEFSSHRAPDMCRFVRQFDRNANTYPFLHYPEIYVLSGGYKEFFEKYSVHCTPQTYRPMNLEEFSNDCRQYRIQTKQEVVSTKAKSSSRLPKVSGPSSARTCGLKKFNI